MPTLSGHRHPALWLPGIVLLNGLALLAATAHGQEGAITNPGFEQLQPDGRPTDWEPLGSAQAETGEAHSGQRALHLVRTPDTRGEVGLNRAWKPGSGERGAMVAARQGGFRFWYKAVAAQPADALTIQAIPMTRQPVELGGQRVIWRVPADQVGDGQWHEGRIAYDWRDLEAVAWVQVGARLLGPVGDLWLDDLEWLAEVGPVLQVAPLAIRETPGQEGEAGLLTSAILNLGDREAVGVRCRLELPPGLSATQGPADVLTIPPGGRREVTWALSGRRDRTGLRLHLAAAMPGQQVTAVLNLAAAEVVPAGLRCSQRLVPRGAAVTVELLARQAGPVIVPNLAGQLEAPPSLRVEPVLAAGDVRLGLDCVVSSWRVTALETTPLAWLTARLGAGGEPARTPLTVVSRLPLEAPALPAAGLTAAVVGDRAVIGTERARLILEKEASGWGTAVLQARVGPDWRPVAALPCLGLLASPDAEVALVADQATAESSGTGARLRLSGQATAAGTTWAIQWEFSARPDRDLIGFALRATPTAPAAISAFEGPLLYAGEGVTAPRRDAILPGQEWLVEGEVSSNALDIRPEHPDRIRYVPHPHKVTVPAAGLTVGDAVVGLLWDVPARQASAAVAGPLALAFASPDAPEGHQSHLLGLSLPAVGHGRSENARRAETPLAVAAGLTLEIQAQLLARPATPEGALDAISVWFGEYGVPEPLPYPHQTPHGEVAFSLQAYAKDLSLWNPEWGKWRAGLIAGGPTTPTDAPAFELAFGAQFVDDPAATAAARTLAAEVWAIPPDRVPDRIQHRTDPRALLARAREARTLMARQAPDGTWRFGGEKAGAWPENGVNYEVLGPVGASEVGLSARAATTVLEYALLSGDAEARAAGLKALEALRGFRVPRAAQVWEVPVHTPDILASAQAIDAYLAGYRLTGEARFVQEAAYWARTGLPFVYTWSPPDLPAMQGATIPVFGATSYVLSWFAVAVQWNGLVYSDALFDLADLDPSFPWAKVAENILRSAMYQQATEGDRLGQWPDALNFIAGRPGLHGQTPPCFRPATILYQTWRTLGAPALPQTVPVRRGEEWLALRGTAAFGLDPDTWTGDALAFTATYTPPVQGAVEVFGLERPTAVTIAGRPVRVAGDVWAGEAPAWTWHEATASLEVRLAGSGAHRVRVEGVRPRHGAWSPPVLRVLDVDFAASTGEGWEALHDLSPLTLKDGALEATVTGADPYLERGSLALDGQAGDILVVRLSCTGGPQGGSVFWGTEQEPGYSPKRELSFRLKGDGSLEEVRVAVGKAPGWAGQTITALRLDPGAGGPGARIRLAAVRCEPAGKP